MAGVQYLRRLKVPIPDTVKDRFRPHNFLRFAITYSKPSYDGLYVGKIMIYLVPPHGATFNDMFPKIKDIPLKTSDSRNYSLNAHELAKDTSRLTEILSQ